MCSPGLHHYMPGCHGHPPARPLQGERPAPRGDKTTLPLTFMEEEVHRSLSCLLPPPSEGVLRRAVSTTEVVGREAASAWVLAVRGEVVRRRACDEVSEEFRRAGIGQCFRGEIAAGGEIISRSLAGRYLLISWN